MELKVVETGPIELAAGEPLANMFHLSPYVWTDNGNYEMALRAVNRSLEPDKKIARIYHGTSRDGRRFNMDAFPIIAPGPQIADSGGCEDPSVIHEAGACYVFYSGYNPVRHETTLRVAVGESIHTLAKRGQVFSDDRYRNPKEVTVVKAADHTWRMFFEYAQDNKSKIGLAASDSLDGPWSFADFDMPARHGKWDNWHLSPGPIVDLADKIIMFYNGARKKPAWRIGWIELDRDCMSVMHRSDDFLIGPGPVSGDATDIAFAASALIENEQVHLYYSESDQKLMKATIQCRPGQHP